MFKSDSESVYDEHRCLKDFNDLAAFHNQYLQQAIITLQEENPGTTIVYGDYYNAFNWLLYNAPYLGNSYCKMIYQLIMHKKAIAYILFTR